MPQSNRRRLASLTPLTIFALFASTAPHAASRVPEHTREATGAPEALQCTTPVVVDTTSDDTFDGMTLRDAVDEVCDGGTITFGVTGTIQLQLGFLFLNKNLTIDGPGAGQLAVSALFSNPAFNVQSGWTVTIRGITITNGGQSGIQNSGSLTLDEIALTGNANEFDGYGGGIASAGALTIRNSTVSGNTAMQGGGGVSISAGTLRVVNSTLSGNQTLNASGGAVYLASGAASTFIHATVTNNSAAWGWGGGIYYEPGDEGMLLRNSIVAGNFLDGTPDDVWGDVAEDSSQFNLIGAGDDILDELTNGVNGNQIGTSASPIAPLLGPLANNGGPTWTHALLAGSPALDAAAIATDPVTTLPILADQRGQLRPIDDASVANAVAGDGTDIGAYEAPASTGPPDMQAASDTGVSDADDVTQTDMPTFDIGGVTPGIDVELVLDGSTVIASGSTPGTTISLTPGAPIAPGPHTVTARHADTVGGPGPASDGLSITIDVTAGTPAIDQDAGQADPVKDPLEVVFTAVFPEPIAPGTFAESDIEIGGTAGALFATITEISPMDGTTFSVAVSGMSLFPGTVTASILGGGVEDLAGNLFAASSSTDNQVTVLPCSSVVINTDDSGFGSLRQAILDGCDGEEITFDPSLAGQTITLLSEIVIDKYILLDGFDAHPLTISGGNAVRLFHVTPDGAFDIFGLTLANGSALASLPPGGGAIYSNTACIGIANSTLIGNTAEVGGALFFGADGVVACGLIVNTTFSGNTASDGGAIATEGVNGGFAEFQLVNTTLSGNTATMRGGAIFVGAESFVDLSNATVTGNRSDADDSGGETGGGVHSTGAPLLYDNSIVAGNLRGTGLAAVPDDAVAEILEESSNNLIGVDVGVNGIVNGVNGNQIGTPLAPIDPRLGPLANNGGMTQTHALLPGSPAIDAGNDCACFFPFDQREFLRFRDGADPDDDPTVDIGAFEADPDIEDIPDQSTPEETPLVVNFHSGEDDIPFDLIVATADNTTLVPDANIIVSNVVDLDWTLNITPAPDQFGTTTITVVATKTIDTDVVTTQDTFLLTVGNSNDGPTLDEIADPAPILEDAALQTINLTGISAGPGGEPETVTITATSSNPALVPDPSVDYTSPAATGSLSYAPLPNANGMAEITVQVNDGVTTLDRTFIITVTAVNDPPTISAVSGQTTNEDTATGTIGFTIADVDTALASLSVSAASANGSLVPNTPANLTLGGSLGDRTIVVTPAADVSGSALITLTVNDGADSTPTDFALTVLPINDPPSLNPITDPAPILEDAGLQTINFSGVARGGIGETDTLVVTAASDNPSVIPNPSVSYTSPNGEGTLSYTPVPNANGSALITVTVDDGTVQTAQAFTVSVMAVNDPPTISTVANQTIDEDTTTGPLAFTIADVDGDGLSVSASSSTTLITASGLVLGGSGGSRTIIVTPAPDRFGSAVVTLEVFDGLVSATSTFTVTVNAVNDGPTLDPITSPAPIVEDAGPQTITLTGIGPGGISESDVLVVSATSDNTALIPNPSVTYTSPNATGSISYTPVANASGSATITVTVTDGVLPVARQFVVAVSPANDTPTISTVPNQTTPEDTPIGPLPFTIADIDGLVGLAVSASSSNTTLVPNVNLQLGGSGADRSLVVTPAANQSGATLITLTVSDGIQSAFSSFTLTVTPVNDAPTISGISDQTLDEGVSSGPLTFTVSDPEGTPLTVTGTSSNPLVVPPGGIVLTGSGNSRAVTINPTTTNGSAIITLTVSDGQLSASTTFVVTVENSTPEPAPSSSPRISTIEDQRVFAGRTLGPLAFTIGDDDSPIESLIVIAESNNDSAVPQSAISLGGDGAGRTITFNIPTGRRGVAEIRLSVSDGGQASATTFFVTVDGPPLAPLDLRASVRDLRIVDLSWRIPSADSASATAMEDPLPPRSGATSFRIEVGSASGLSDVRTFTTGVTTTFSIADLPPGSYFMRVRGINDGGIGAPSNEVRVTLGAAVDAPQRLRASIVASTVQLDWDAPLDGLPVDGYQVEASFLINATNIGLLTTIDPQLVVGGVPNGVYYARVRGIRGGALTSVSNEIVVIVGPDSCTAPPNAPAGIAIGADGNFVGAQWLPPLGPQPVERYILSVGSGPGLSDRGAFEFGPATLAAGAVVADGTYVVRVAAANRCGISAPTAEASITIGGPAPELPGAPGTLVATVIGSTVQLEWTAPTSGGAPTRYIIEVTNPAGAPLTSFDTGNVGTAFTQGGTPPGTYVVRVRAANGAGAGPASPPVVVTVP